MNRVKYKARQMVRDLLKSKQEIKEGKCISYTFDELLADMNKPKLPRFLKKLK